MSRASRGNLIGKIITQCMSDQNGPRNSDVTKDVVVTYFAKESEMCESKLVQGRIPIGQECPFKSQCPYVPAGDCGHQGIKHTVAYSCGTARLFDLASQQPSEKK